MTKKVLKKILTNLTDSLNKSKPNQLIELFDILKVVKQQGILTEADVNTTKSALEAFAQSESKFLKNQRVRKPLKKVLSFYGLKVKLDVGGKKAAATKPMQHTASDNGVVATESSVGAGGGGDERQGKKKKKKKSGQKKKKEEKLAAAEAEDPAAVPSFARCLVDTTKVYVNTEKRKNKKRKGKGGGGGGAKAEASPQQHQNNQSNKKVSKKLKSS